MENIFQKRLVAKKNGLKWKWEPIADLGAVKIRHRRKKDDFETKIVENETFLYLLEINKTRLNQSYSAALKISGSPYALVLMITDGKKGKAFNRHHFNISNHKLLKNGKEYLDIFESIIKEYGIYVAEMVDGKPNWSASTHYDEKIITIKTYYQRKRESFYVLENKLYYLKPVQSVVEDLFWKCMSLTGGSEKELAKELAQKESEVQAYYMALRRMSFKHAYNFSLYSKLFSNFIQRNRQLFEVDL